MNPPVEKGELTKVRNFMEAYDQPIRFRPIDNLPEHEKIFRIALIQEELRELAQALNVDMGPLPLLVCKDRKLDPVAVLDALTDLMYVLLGAYHTFGLAICAKEAFEEVHNSNMSKLGDDDRPIKNAAGKVLKGPYYFPPNLEAIVRRSSRADVIFDPTE